MDRLRLGVGSRRSSSPLKVAAAQHGQTAIETSTPTHVSRREGQGNRLSPLKHLALPFQRYSGSVGPTDPAVELTETEGAVNDL